MSFRFEAPWMLLLLLLIPALAAMPILMKKIYRPAGLRYADTTGLPEMPRSWRQYAYFVLPIFRWLALAMMIVALARPQSGHAREVVKGEGVDIALALDISGSMASLDFKPKNRMEAAKQVISNFIDERQYDRIGLVVFARDAFNQSPPTTDHHVLERLLTQVKLSTDLKLDDGTAIGMGLANAANMLKDSPVKSKVIILLTDGVNNAGQIDPLTAAEAAKALGIKVYTIAAAKTGEVPVPQQGIFGPRVVYQQSEIDEQLLRDIAEKTGGLYFRAEDTAGLQKIYDEINGLETSQIEIRRYTRYAELAHWLLIPALALLLLEAILRRTIFRKLP